VDGGGEPVDVRDLVGGREIGTRAARHDILDRAAVRLQHGVALVVVVVPADGCDVVVRRVGDDVVHVPAALDGARPLSM
jgi:hypothetical protein